jgi:hypothetical protein
VSLACLIVLCLAILLWHSALPIVAADEPTSSRSPRLTLAIYRTTEDGVAFATRGQLLSDWTLAIV